MSQKNQLLTPEDWFHKARRDWKQAEERLGEGETEDAAFMLHQSMEKYLKGYVVSNGWELKHTHDVGDLIQVISEHKPEFGSFADLGREISEYYFLEWNPDPSKVPTREKVDEVIEQSKELVEKIVKDVRR